MNIAIVEDDPLQSAALFTWLREAGHSCDRYERADEFKQRTSPGDYQLLLLDWEMPGLSGIELLSQMRRELNDETPVIFITARESERDIVMALNTGADDYVVKPARRMELLARIDAATRRLPETQSKQTHGNLEVDELRKEIRLDGVPVELTSKELSLACFLLNNINRLLSRDEIRQHVWQNDNRQQTRTVDTHISRLRKKLQLTREHGWHLAAVYQYGYRLDRVN